MRRSEPQTQFRETMARKMITKGYPCTLAVRLLITAGCNKAVRKAEH